MLSVVFTISIYLVSNSSKNAQTKHMIWLFLTQLIEKNFKLKAFIFCVKWELRKRLSKHILIFWVGQIEILWNLKTWQLLEGYFLLETSLCVNSCSCIFLFHVASCKKKNIYIYKKKRKEKKRKKNIQEQHFSVSVAWSKLKKKYTPKKILLR